MQATGSRPSEPSFPLRRASLSLAEAIRARDLDSALSHFEPDACLITPDATAVHGLGEIRPILAQMIDAGAVIQVESGSLVRVGEIALGAERLRFQSSGAPYRQTFSASTVLRRREDDWRIAIAAPWGWGHEDCRCAQSVMDRRHPGSHLLRGGS